MPSDGPDQPAAAVIPVSLIPEAVRLLFVHGDMTDGECGALIASIANDALRAELAGDEEIAEDVQQQIVCGIRDTQQLVGLLRDHAESVHGLRCGAACIARQLYTVLMATGARIGALASDHAALFLGYCTRADVLAVCAGVDGVDLADIAEAFVEDDSAATDPRETFDAIVDVMQRPERLDTLAVAIERRHPEYAHVARARAAFLRGEPRTHAHP